MKKFKELYESERAREFLGDLQQQSRPSNEKRVKFLKLFQELYVSSNKMTNLQSLLDPKTRQRVADVLGVDLSGHTILGMNYILSNFKPSKTLGIANWVSHRSSNPEKLIAALLSTIVGSKRYERKAPSYSTEGGLKLTSQYNKPELVDITEQDKIETLKRIASKLPSTWNYLNAVVKSMKEQGLWDPPPAQTTTPVSTSGASTAI